MASPNLVPVKAKPIWTTKSFWLGVAVALLPIVESLQDDLGAVIEQDWILSIIGALIVAVRLVTKQPATASPNTTQKLVERV